jgi:hypothetical protein
LRAVRARSVAPSELRGNVNAPHHLVTHAYRATLQQRVSARSRSIRPPLAPQM